MRAPDRPGPQGQPPFAVLFDMDGLLVASEELWYDTEVEVMAGLGGPWGREHQAALVGGPLHASAQYLLDLAASPVPRAEVEQALVAGMERRLRAGPVRWMPGAARLLGEVEAAGVPRALVSASHRRLVDAVLAAIGPGRFTTTVAGDEVARTKPHPDPYLLAARRLGVPPQACLVLEDSATGAAAGLAAGCVTVVVPSLAPVPPSPGLRRAASLEELDLPRLRAEVAAA